MMTGQAQLPTSEQPLIVVCYSTTSKDNRRFADVMVKTLTEIAGHHLTFTLSADQREEADQQIGQSAAILFIISSSGFRSLQLQAQLKLAQSQHKLIIPVIINDFRAFSRQFADYSFVRWQSTKRSYKAVGHILYCLQHAGILEPLASDFMWPLALIQSDHGETSTDWHIYHTRVSFGNSRVGMALVLLFYAAAIAIIPLVFIFLCILFLQYAVTFDTISILPKNPDDTKFLLVVGEIILSVLVYAFSAWAIFGDDASPPNPMIIISPLGIAQRDSGGDYRGWTFAEILNATLPAQLYGESRVQIVPRNQPAVLINVLTKGKEHQSIAHEIITSFAQFRTEQSSVPSAVVNAPPEPVAITTSVVALCAVADDNAFVTRLSDKLRKRGYTPWLMSQQWSDEVRQTIDGAALVVVILTARGAHAEHVQQQYEYAVQQGKVVIPVLIKSRRKLPPMLGNHQWVDFSRLFVLGWLDLVVAIEIAGVPMPPATFDGDLAIARTLRGLTPYTWNVYQPPEIDLSALTFFLFFLPVFDIFELWTRQDSFLWLFIFDLGLLSFITAIWLAARLHLFEPKLPTRFVITPTGFAVSKNGQIDSLPFRDIATIEYDKPSQGAARLNLTANLGSKIVAMVEIPSALRADKEITTQVKRQLQNYLHAYQAAEPTVTTTLPLVFISHARHDRKVVDQLDAQIHTRGAGIDTWVDRRRLAGGQQWPAELQHAIEACTALVVIVTPRSLASAVVRQEYLHALQLGKPVVALVLHRISRQRIPSELQTHLIYGGSNRATQVDNILIGLNDIGIGPAPLTLAQENWPYLNSRLRQKRLPAGCHVYWRRQPVAVAPYLRWLAALAGGCGAFLALNALIAHNDSRVPITIGLSFIVLAAVIVSRWVRRFRQRELTLTTPTGYMQYIAGKTYFYPFTRALIPSPGKGAATYNEDDPIITQIRADYQRFLASSS